LVEPIGSQDDDDFDYLSDESKLLYVAKRVMINNNLYAGGDIHNLLTEEQLNTFRVDIHTDQRTYTNVFEFACREDVFENLNYDDHYIVIFGDKESIYIPKNKINRIIVKDI